MRIDMTVEDALRMPYDAVMPRGSLTGAPGFADDGCDRPRGTAPAFSIDRFGIAGHISGCGRRQAIRCPCVAVLG